MWNMYSSHFLKNIQHNKKYFWGEKCGVVIKRLIFTPLIDNQNKKEYHKNWGNHF